jgi:S1-C subfamily serine protease
MLAIAWMGEPDVLSELQGAPAISKEPFNLGWQVCNEYRYQQAFRIGQMHAGRGIVGAQINLAQKLPTKMPSSAPEATSQPFSDESPGTSVGTAWPIASGYVVTNDHVIAESTDVMLINHSGQEITAQVVLRDETGDIAILEVSDIQKLPPALPLATAQARLGANVFTIGFPRPDVMGKTPKLSEGVISAINGLFDNPESYQTTVPIQPGNSGGPLFNMKGEVIAVVKSMLGVRDERRGDITILQNISCASKIRCVRELLSLLPRQDPVINELAGHSGNLETLAARVQGSVLMVVTR